MPDIVTADKCMWSLDVVKTHVKATTTDYDTTIARLANGVSARLESDTNRVIVTEDITEYPLTRRRSSKVWLRTYPIQTVTSLAYRTTMRGDWITVGATEFELDAELGAIHLLIGLSPVPGTDGFAFPTGPRLVKALYTAGFDDQGGDDLPQDLYNLGLDWIKTLYDRWRSDLISSSSVSEGGRSISIPSGIPSDLQDAVDGYRKIRI